MIKNVVVVNEVTNKVVNFIVIDDDNPISIWGTYFVDLPENTLIKFGYTWDGEKFLNEHGLPILTGSNTP
jgi:hypothetical protein